MAIPSWLTVTPKEGSNNADITLVASELTGRTQRSGTVHGATKGTSDIASATADLPVSQVGKAEHITLDSGETTKSVVATGGTVTVTGVTNCGVLKLAATSTVISGVKATLQIDKESGSTISWSDVSGWDGITSTTVTGEPGETHEYRFKITFTIPANETTSERKHILSLTNGGTSVSSAQITITQLTGTKTYSEITISSVSCDPVPSDGTKKTVNVSYSQTWGWNGSTTGGGTITSDATTSISSSSTALDIDGMSLYKNDDTTFIQEGSNAGTYTVHVSLNGKTATKDFVPTRVGNDIQSISVSIVDPEAVFNYSDMTAADTTNEPHIEYRDSGEFEIKCTFNSGSIVDYYNGSAEINEVLDGWFEINFNSTFERQSGNSNMSVNSSTGVVTSDMGTTWSSGRSCVVKLTVALTGTNITTSTNQPKASISTTATCIQSPNLITKIALSGYSISYSKSVPASGSTSVAPTEVMPKTTYTYSSGKSTLAPPTDESGGIPAILTAATVYTAGTAQNGFSTANTSTGVMTSESCGTTVTSARNSSTIKATVTATLTASSSEAKTAGQVTLTATAEASDYATQVANTASYGDVVITGDYTEANDIPASGGSRASISTYKSSQTVTYTSGSTREGSISSSWSTSVSADTKGTTASDRNSVGTLTVTATGEGSKTATKSYTVYQAANAITDYGAVTILQSSPVSIAPAGRTYVMDTAISQTMTYTSGAKRNISAAVSKSWSVKTTCEGFSLDKNTNSVTITQNPGVTQRGPYVVTYSVTGEGSKTASKDITFTQQAASSYISFNPNSLTFIAAGETKTVTVSSNDSWTLS